MGAVDTTYTFTATDTITSAKMNNIIDQTTMTSSAIIGTTLEVASGQLKVRAQGITSNELGTDSVTTNAIADGSVTSAKLNSSVILVPAGAIMAFAMNTAPTGWLAANGASVSTTTYATLFAAIGYTYGGSGGSFNLPDLRGYFVRGAGTNSDGTVSDAFGTKQQDAFASHSHVMAANALYAYASGPGGGTGGGSNYAPVNPATRSTNNTGSTETRPRNIAMLYCIKI